MCCRWLKRRASSSRGLWSTRIVSSGGRQSWPFWDAWSCATLRLEKWQTCCAFHQSLVCGSHFSLWTRSLYIDFLWLFIYIFFYMNIYCVSFFFILVSIFLCIFVLFWLVSTGCHQYPTSVLKGNLLPFFLHTFYQRLLFCCCCLCSWRLQRHGVKNQYFNPFSLLWAVIRISWGVQHDPVPPRPGKQP